MLRAPPLGHPLQKNGGPMGYGRLARARTMSQMSQCLRSLVLLPYCSLTGLRYNLFMIDGHRWARDFDFVADGRFESHLRLYTVWLAYAFRHTAHQLANDGPRWQECRCHDRNRAWKFPHSEKRGSDCS